VVLEWMDVVLWLLPPWSNELLVVPLLYAVYQRTGLQHELLSAPLLLL
jgi:hypothetical protein